MNLFFHKVADPMHQFEVQKWFELPPVFGYDISFTNAAGFMLLGVVLCIAFFGYAASRGKIVPNRLQCSGWETVEQTQRTGESTQETGNHSIQSK